MDRRRNGDFVSSAPSLTQRSPSCRTRAVVDQHRQHLLDVQRVALGGGHDASTERVRQAGSNRAGWPRSAPPPHRRAAAARSRRAPSRSPQSAWLSSSSWRAVASNSTGASSIGLEQRSPAGRGTPALPSGCRRSSRRPAVRARSARAPCARPSRSRAAGRRPTRSRPPRPVVRRRRRRRPQPRASRAPVPADLPGGCRRRRRTISRSGQNVMPSPYGRQRPMTMRAPRVARARHELANQLGLADAGVADHRHQARLRACRTASSNAVCSAASSALAPDDRRVVAPHVAVLAVHVDQPVRRHRLRLALERQRLDRLDLDGVASPAARSPRRCRSGSRARPTRAGP